MGLLGRLPRLPIAFALELRQFSILLPARQKALSLMLAQRWFCQVNDKDVAAFSSRPELPRIVVWRVHHEHRQ